MIQAFAVVFSFLLALVPGFGAEAVTPVAETHVESVPGEIQRATPEREQKDDPPPAPQAPAEDEADDGPPPPKETAPPRYVKPRVPQPAPFKAWFLATEVAVGPGGLVPVTLRVHNELDKPLTLYVALANVTPGWIGSVPSERLDLEPHEATDVSGYLEAPADAEPGASGSVEAVVRSVAPQARMFASVHGVVPEPEVQRGVSLHGGGSRYVAPGGTANYTITITNLGNRFDAFTLSAPAGAPGWSWSLSPQVVRLEAGAATTALLRVTAPQDAHNEDAAFFNVTALSNSDRSYHSTTRTLTVVDDANAGLDVDLDVVCVRLPPPADSTDEMDAYEHVCVDTRGWMMFLPHPDES